QPPLRLSAVLVVLLVLSVSPVAAQQGLVGTDYHNQPGWHYAADGTMNPSPFTGWSLSSDGGFQPSDGLHGPPPSFWFYQPAPTLRFYSPSSFRFYDPSPSFWLYRSPPSFWLYHPHH